MGTKVACFARNAQRFQARLDGCRQVAECGAGFYAGPEDARPARVREEAQSRKAQLDRSGSGHFAESGADALDPVRWRLADELERDMRTFDPHPARGVAELAQLPAQLRQGVEHGFRDVQGHEEAHGFSPIQYWPPAERLGTPGG